jgi:hypothetical protein
VGIERGGVVEMSGLKFLKIEEAEDSLRKVRIEKTEDMTEKDVNDFCDWVCKKALLKGFEVRDITEDESGKVD